MSYITVIPLIYRNGFSNQPAIIRQPQTQNPSILTCLGEALRISLNRYQKAQQLLNQKKEEQKLIDFSLSVQKKQENPTLTPKEEPEKKVQNSKKNDKENKLQKAVKLTIQSEKNAKESSQHLTNDQLILNNNAQRDSNRKNGQRQHRIKKDKHKHKKNHLHIKIPDIILIDTANCSKLAMNIEAMSELREKLLQRQVWNWSEKVKNRRDKREIRMLNC